MPENHPPAVEPLLQEAVRRLAPVLPLLLELGERFAAAGHELALVGGPVRDAFLGRGSLDLDLTTSARPEETERITAGWADAQWDMGRAFGTIGLRKNTPSGAQTVEITTYRADEYDRHTRKPVVAFGDNLTDDLVRRDFTVNAMALRLPALEFVDPHGGLEDLAARRLRTPAPAEVSFGDDPLRMMRAARFVAQLGFDLDPAVRAAMEAMAGSLEIVSAERIRDEFSKLLLAPDPVPGIRVLVDTGLAAQMLPELPALKLEIDEHHRHKDVYEHSLTVLRQAIALESEPEVAAAGDGVTADDANANANAGDPAPRDAEADAQAAAQGDPEAMRRLRAQVSGEVPAPDLVLRLAALLHDIGKPGTRRFEAGGGVSFHHHEVVGAKLVTKRLRALRYDKETIKAVARLVELHLRFHGYGGGEWTDSAVRRYVTDAGDLLSRLHRLTRADCTTRNAKKAARLWRTYDSLEERIARLTAEEGLKKVRPDLDGNEIGEILGLPPGPVLGRAYKHLLAVRLDEGPLGKEAAADRLRAWWAQQPEAQG